MSDSYKISGQELSLLTDQEFLLTKRVIDSKVSGLLLSAQQNLSEYIKNDQIELPSGVSTKPRKIAKGENYQSLPYWVSDYPAVLTKDHVWSFRTVVWWGHEVSFSLILKGKFRPSMHHLRIPNHSVDLLYSTHTDPWKLELTPAYSTSFEQKSDEKIRRHYDQTDFIRLSERLTLNKINQLPEQSVISFDKIMNVLNYLA